MKISELKKKSSKAELESYVFLMQLRESLIPFTLKKVCCRKLTKKQNWDIKDKTDSNTYERSLLYLALWW